MIRPWPLFEEGPEPPASSGRSLPAPLVLLVSLHKLARLGWPLERLKLALPLLPPSRQEKISRLKMAPD
jgi:hypothetical protein